MLDGLAGWIVPFNRNPWSSISIPWPHGIAWIRCHVNKVQGGSAVERVGGRTCDSTLGCGAGRLFRPRSDPSSAVRAALAAVFPVRPHAPQTDRVTHAPHK
jgi:hypothetical protein